MSKTITEMIGIFVDFEKKYWDAARDEAGYTRHTLEHLAKLMGKMGAVIEPREHGLQPSTEIIKHEVIPDLLYFAMGLAQQHEVDLEAAFLQRLEQNAAKIEGRRQGILEKSSLAS